MSQKSRFSSNGAKKDAGMPLDDNAMRLLERAEIRINKVEQTHGSFRMYGSISISFEFELLMFFF